MTTMEILALVLSSSLASAVISTVLGGMISGWLKRIDYADEYYRQVLQRRIEVYELLEAEIGILKQSCLADDGKAYHLIFAYGINSFYDLQKGLMAVMAKSLWLSDELQDIVVSINRELLDASFIAQDDEELINVGKEKYQKIASLRHQLEQRFSRDIGALHQIKFFLKRKAKSKHEFSLFEINSRVNS
ncbi:hypothetical protein [Pseudomonas aeruginosa]